MLIWRTIFVMAVAVIGEDFIMADGQILGSSAVQDKNHTANNIRKMIDELEYKDYDRRKEIIGELIKIGKESIPYMIDALDHHGHRRSHRVRHTALKVLGTVCSDHPSEKVIKRMIEVLRKDHIPGVRTASAEALGKIGPPAKSAVPDLVLALSDDSGEEVREFCIAALGKIKLADPYVIDALKVSLVKDDYRHARSEAATALGEMGVASKDAIPQLIKALKDDDYQYVRSESAEALGKIGIEAKEAIPHLIEAIKNDDEKNVRCKAIEAIGEMRDAAKVAIPTLKKALKDKESSIRAYAALALKKIDTK